MSCINFKEINTNTFGDKWHNQDSFELWFTLPTVITRAKESCPQKNGIKSKAFYYHLYFVLHFYMSLLFWQQIDHSNLHKEGKICFRISNNYRDSFALFELSSEVGIVISSIFRTCGHQNSEILYWWRPLATGHCTTCNFVVKLLVSQWKI